MHSFIENNVSADRQVALGVFKAMSENKVEGEEKDAVQRLIEELKG